MEKEQAKKDKPSLSEKSQVPSISISTSTLDDISTLTQNTLISSPPLAQISLKRKLQDSSEYPNKRLKYNESDSSQDNSKDDDLH